MSRRKSVRQQQQAQAPELLNKREREDFQPQGPRKPKKLPPVVRVADEGKRDRTVPVPARPKPNLGYDEETEVLVYLVRRGRDGWQADQAVMPMHVVQGYAFEPVAGPGSVDLVMARLCERVEFRAYTVGK
jgi:hypothetical protein